MKLSVESAAEVMPSSTGSDVAGSASRYSIDLLRLLPQIAVRLAHLLLRDDLAVLELASPLVDDDDLVAQALVLLLELQLVHVVPFEELRVARIDDAHLLHHLADDDLDVLVVDLHALDAVDFLDFVHQVLLHRRPRP